MIHEADRFLQGPTVHLTAGTASSDSFSSKVYEVSVAGDSEETGVTACYYAGQVLQGPRLYD